MHLEYQVKFESLNGSRVSVVVEAVSVSDAFFHVYQLYKFRKILDIAAYQPDPVKPDPLPWSAFYKPSQLY